MCQSGGTYTPDVAGQRSGVTRQAKSAAIDEALLDAAVAVIRRDGPDDLNISEVARTAGVTNGAYYARYENAHELLLAVWQRRCAEPFMQIVSLAGRAATGSTQAAAELSRALSAADPRIDVAAVLLIAAPRIEELSESALPELRAWLARARADGTVPDAALIPVGFAVGAVCFNAAVDAPSRDWSLGVSLMGPIAALPPVKAVGTAAAWEPIPYELRTDDPTRKALLRGALDVIARSGLKRSSTSRMARAAGLPQAAFFSVWRTRAEAVHEIVTFALEGLTAGGRPFGSAFLEGDSDGAAAGLSRVLAPGAHDQRRIRLEIVLAGMYDADVSRLVHASDAETVQLLSPDRLPYVEALRAVVLGLILLEECVGGMAEVDFAPVVRLLTRLT